jgi:DNA-binding transcriptional regulator YiaG
MTEITTKVGRYKVTDASAIVPEAPDGTVELTAVEALGYERRAAHVVFFEAKVVEGAELKFARKALALKQAELAKLLGVDACTVSHWEGSQPIQRTTQLAIAALIDQALRGPSWPPRAWIETKPTNARRGCFEVTGRKVA